MHLGTEEVTNIQSIATGDWYGGKEENSKSLQKSSVIGGLFPGSNKAVGCYVGSRYVL